MNILRNIVARIAAEFRSQRVGHRALREIKFAKFKIAAQQDALLARERLLRRLPRSWQISPMDRLTTY